MLLFRDNFSVVEITRVNADGTGKTVIVVEDNIHGFHSAPDGSLIAYTYLDASVGMLAVCDPDGTNKTVLVATGVDSVAPSWTLDGSQIMYHEGGDLRLINPDGSGATTILAGGLPGFGYAEGMATDRYWFTNTTTHPTWRLAYVMLDGSGMTVISPTRRLSQAVQRGVAIWRRSAGARVLCSLGSRSASRRDLLGAT